MKASQKPAVPRLPTNRASEVWHHHSVPGYSPPLRHSTDQRSAPRSLLPLAVFMAAMAFLWASLATGSGLGVLRLLGFAGMAGAIILPVIGVIKGRPVGSTSGSTPQRRPARTSPGRLFLVGVAVEAAIITAAVLVLRSLDRSDAALPVIATVVGAHFVIFYLLQGARLHLWTTVAGITSGAVPLALAASGAVSPVDANALTGLGMGAVTATYAWVFARTVRGGA